MASVRTPKRRSRRRSRMVKDYRGQEERDAKPIRSLAPKAIGLFELVAQLGRAQIFANMRQALLQSQRERPRRLRCWCAQCRATWSTGWRRDASSRAARGRPHPSAPAHRRLSSSSSALSAVATNCGRWLTQATSSSWRAASRSMTLRAHRDHPFAPAQDEFASRGVCALHQARR